MKGRFISGFARVRVFGSAEASPISPPRQDFDKHHPCRDSSPRLPHLLACRTLTLFKPQSISLEKSSEQSRPLTRSRGPAIHCRRILLLLPLILNPMVRSDGGWLLNTHSGPSHDSPPILRQFRSDMSCLKLSESMVLMPE